MRPDCEQCNLRIWLPIQECLPSKQEMSNDTQTHIQKGKCYVCKYLDTDYIILSYKYIG